jgi:hypothetical protein
MRIECAPRDAPNIQLAVKEARKQLEAKNKPEMVKVLPTSDIESLTSSIVVIPHI